MYAIYLNNKRYNTKNFPSYEAARSWARKLIRAGKIPVANFYRWDIGGDFYNNPSLSVYNVSIKAV